MAALQRTSYALTHCRTSTRPADLAVFAYHAVASGTRATMLPPLAISHRAASRLALGVAGIFTIAALAIALCARPFEYGCEYDKYHVMAERVLRRQLPDDVFRPTGYVMLTAAMGLLGAPCFAAAKAIAALAGGATVYACWHIGAQLVRPSVALLACVLTALNPVLQQWSVTAAPDSLFLLGFCLCLLAMLHHRRHPSNATGAAIGLTFACAYFTRYPAIALLPAIAWVLLRSARGHARVAQVASFAAAAGVGLVPHMIVSYRQFRRLFYDENWRNLALRHFGGENDWSYLFDNPFTGVWSVLTHDPWRIAANTLAELLGVEGRGVAEMLFREVAPAAQPALLLLTALGFVPLLRGRQRSLAVVLLLASASYLLLVCATFYALNRVLLPILPACSLALAAAMAWSPRGAGATAAAGQGLARALRALAVAGVVGGLAVASALHIQDFLRHQHRDVVTTTAEFQAAAGRRLTVLSNFEFLDRHIGCELVPMRVTDSQATWTLVAARVASGDIELVALSGVDDPWRFASLMAVAPPSNLSLVRRTNDVAVFAVR